MGWGGGSISLHHGKYPTSLKLLHKETLAFDV